MKAFIFEQGNGLPDAGDYCTDSDYLYRVQSIDSRIHLGDRRGNYVHAQVERVKWDACTQEDQHTAIVCLDL
jgi:hypothetical protein